MVGSLHMKLLGMLRNGKKVYYDPVHSHFATHLADTPQLLELAKALLEQQSFDEPLVFLEHDAGRTIGLTDLVDVADHETIVYAKRLNRDTYTPFVKGHHSVPSQYFTVVLKRDDLGDYELFSAWIGRNDPPFPDEPHATLECRTFWATHALVWGTQAIQPGTETTICPW